MANKYKLRSMIVAPKGKLLVQVDLSQAETWIVAYLANDPKMKEFLLTSDIHVETAREIFDKPTGIIIVEERYIGKQNNHANSYDMTAVRQAQVINKRSDQPPYVTVTISQCNVYQEKWHGLYPNVRQVFHVNIREQLSKNMTLITPYHRRRVFFLPWGKELFKSAYAHVPQSTISDHFHGRVQRELGIKGGLLEIRKNLVSHEVLIINDSHDSCILEAPKDVATEVGERARSFLRRPVIVNGEEVNIPVDLEIGERWGELTKIKEK